MEHHETSASRGERFAALVARALVYAVHVYLVIVELILGLGFILLLLGANPSSEFTRWAYRSLDRAMGPFDGIFEPLTLGQYETVSAVFDTGVLFAMVAYGVVLLLVASLLDRINRWIRGIDIQRRVDTQRMAYDQAALRAADTYPDLIGSASTDASKSSNGGGR